MDSPLQTDFPITLGDKEYTLTFPIPAIWKFEDVSGLDIIGQGISADQLNGATPRERTQRAAQLLYAGLTTYHPEITFDKAASFIYPYNLAEIQGQVWTAFAASLPKANPEEGNDPLANPSPAAN